MGRSVSYPSESIVSFTSLDVEEPEDYQCDWECFVEYQIERAKTLFPSLYSCDKWVGREDHAYLENDFAYFGFSEYCGLVSIWMKSKASDLEDSYYGEEASRANLARSWIDRVSGTFYKSFGTLTKVGTASNGESLFVRSNS